VWDVVVASGAVPYGTEAMHVMRAEKGYIIVGQETDGTATPDDVGMAWAVGVKKPDFVGKRSLARAAMAAPERKQLVGLLTEDPAVVLDEGAQIVADPNQPIPMTMLGHVTSAYRSPALDRSIALAMVAGGRAREGSTLHVPMPDRTIPVRVVDPVFYDKEGVRLDG
jgi:sarcosine oxidase subunit alpha